MWEQERLAYPCRPDPDRCPEHDRQCPQCWHRLDGPSASRLLGRVTTRSPTHRLLQRLERLLDRHPLLETCLSLCLLTLFLTCLGLAAFLGYRLAIYLVH